MNIYWSLADLKEYCENSKCDDCEILDALNICLKAKEWNINTKSCGFCKYYDSSKPSGRVCIKRKCRSFHSVSCNLYEEVNK